LQHTQSSLMTLTGISILTLASNMMVQGTHSHLDPWSL
jgi:hypothetical protein